MNITNKIIFKPAKRELEPGQVWLDRATNTPYMIMDDFRLVSLINGCVYDWKDIENDDDFVHVEANLELVGVIPR